MSHCRRLAASGCKAYTHSHNCCWIGDGSCCTAATAPWHHAANAGMSAIMWSDQLGLTRNTKNRVNHCPDIKHYTKPHKPDGEHLRHTHSCQPSPSTGFKTHRMSQPMQLPLPAGQAPHSLADVPAQPHTGFASDLLLKQLRGTLTNNKQPRAQHQAYLLI